jgi:hypothetical protein
MEGVRYDDCACSALGGGRGGGGWQMVQGGTAADAAVVAAGCSRLGDRCAIMLDEV